MAMQVADHDMASSDRAWSAEFILSAAEGAYEGFAMTCGASCNCYRCVSSGFHGALSKSSSA